MRFPSLDQAGLLSHRVLEVPELNSTNGGLEPAAMRARVLPSLAIAASERSTVVAAWVRRQPHQRVEVLLGGIPGLEGTTYPDGRVGLAYPVGTVGRRLPLGAGIQAIDDLPHWVRCSARFEVPATTTSVGAGRSLDDYFALLAHQPLAWLVVARPAVPELVQDQMESLSLQVADLESQRDGMGFARLEGARAEAQLRYLEEWLTLGLWQLDVWVAGPTFGHARAVAGLLSGSSDLADLPIRLRAEGDSELLPGRTQGQWQAQLLVGSDVVGTLTRPPSRELPGVRIVETPPFDITPETRGSIQLADVLDSTRVPCGPLSISTRTLNRHAFISGATGSGKSQTTRCLLERLACAEPPIPWLVIEPAKAEYRRMASRLAGRGRVVAIRPGNRDAAPASLNPLEPAPGFPLQSHLDLVRALFVAAFEAAEPFPQVLSRALTLAYEEAGWDLVTGRCRVEPETNRAQYPRLSDLQAAARRVVDGIGYGGEVAANVRGFVDVRLGSLRTGSPGRFFEDGHPLDVASLLRQNVVFELENVTDDQDKAFLMGVIVIRLVEHLRVKYGESGCDDLQHITVIEEAHRLLKRGQQGAGGASVEMFASLLAEVRAYGEGVVIVEQIPSKILPDVIKNTALKVIHRLPAADDRDVVGGTVNLSAEQSRAVVAFSPGVAAIAVDGMDRPVMARIPGGASREDQQVPLWEAPLALRRSAYCGADCAKVACSLSQMNDALGTAQREAVVVWFEAVVVALLAGLVPPVARGEVLETLRSKSNRHRACALAYLLEGSVAARRPWLHRYMDPHGFALVVLQQVEYQLEHGESCSVRDYVRWQAGPYRYRDIQQVLRVRAEEGLQIESSVVRAWVERGLKLSGLDASVLKAQLDEVLRHERGDVVLGDTSASGLRGAIVGLAGAADAAGVARAVDLACTGRGAGGVAFVIVKHSVGQDEGQEAAHGS